MGHSSYHPPGPTTPNYFPRIEERAAFALFHDPAKQAEVAAHRGWKFQMVSDAGKESLGR
ncbi:MAG: hypothetical protein R2688_03060 [Fimbriimonadaceae bacterium]